MEPNNTSNETMRMPPVAPVEAAPMAPRTQEQLSTESRIESSAEQSRREVATALQAAAPALPTVAPPPATAQAAPSGPAQSSNPLAAADEEMIEKVWIDRIKEILRDTKEDPHARETQISALQRDYIQKRYGITIGEARD